MFGINELKANIMAMEGRYLRNQVEVMNRLDSIAAQQAVLQMQLEELYKKFPLPQEKPKRKYKRKVKNEEVSNKE